MAGAVGGDPIVMGWGGPDGSREAGRFNEAADAPEGEVRKENEPNEHCAVSCVTTCQ